jgi:ferritin-like metal-binding protein YciE
VAGLADHRGISLDLDATPLAEKKILVALPKIAKAVQTEELSAAFENNLTF